jgi:hypothetical protein
MLFDAKRIMHRLMQTRVSASHVAMMIVVVMAGAAVSAAPLVSAAPRGRGSHTGQSHHRRARKHPGKCITTKRRRTAHVAGAQPAHRRKPKKCKVARHLLKKLLVPSGTLIAPSAPVSSPAPITAPLPVEVLPPPPAASPANAALPVIAGSAAQGQVLDTSSGSWTGSPSSYAYQWQDCDVSGGGCLSLSGATSSTYVLAAGDVGHTLRIIVSASNSAGVGIAVSEPTAAITGVKSTSTGCFSTLVAGEACGGYPNAGDTGVPEGTALTRVTGQLIITKEGETVSNKLLEGGVVIRANNVHLEDDEVVGSPQHECGEKGSGSGVDVVGEPGTENEVSGVVIKHDTIRGVNPTCAGTLELGINIKIGSAATVTAEYNKLYWVARCFQSAATWENNYCLLNGTIYEDHYEDVFEDGTDTLGAGGVVIKHNTLLNFHEQTAVITLFAHSTVGEETVENNFMAGGGYVMYVNPPTEGVVVKGPVRVVGNRVARCTGETEMLKASNEGVHICKGTEPELQESPGSTIKKWEESGLFPLGGSFGVWYTPYEPATVSGNYWDDNLQEIPGP